MSHSGDLPSIIAKGPIHFALIGTRCFVVPAVCQAGRTAQSLVKAVEVSENHNSTLQSPPGDDGGHIRGPLCVGSGGWARLHMGTDHKPTWLRELTLIIHEVWKR